MRKSTRTHTHTCTVCYDMLLRSGFFDFTRAETCFCQRLGFLNIFETFEAWRYEFDTSQPPTPSPGARGSEPRWVSRSLW